MWTAPGPGERERGRGGVGMEATAAPSRHAGGRVASRPGGSEEKSPPERCALRGEGEENRRPPPPGSSPGAAVLGVGVSRPGRSEGGRGALVTRGEEPHAGLQRWPAGHGGGLD